MLSNKPKVLFVCTENACRSQIAEAYARLLGSDLIEVYSSGSEPTEEISPNAVQVMDEVGYDLTSHATKAVTQIPDIEYDLVITMGCGEDCPEIRAKKREDWGLPDQGEGNINELRMIREQIKQKVTTLLAWYQNRAGVNPAWRGKPAPN